MKTLFVLSFREKCFFKLLIGKLTLKKDQVGS
jgi:hypothetical protein